MLLLCLCDPTETIFIFWYDEDVYGCYGCGISKSQHKTVLKDDVGGYLFVNDFIKDGLTAHKDNWL